MGGKNAVSEHFRTSYSFSFKFSIFFRKSVAIGFHALSFWELCDVKIVCRVFTNGSFNPREICPTYSICARVYQFAIRRLIQWDAWFFAEKTCAGVVEETFDELHTKRNGKREEGRQCGWTTALQSYCGQKGNSHTAALWTFLFFPHAVCVFLPKASKK